MRHVSLRLRPLFLTFPFLVIACGPDPAAETEVPAATGAGATTTASCELTMGWDPWEPYQYRDARGEITGLDIDIARAAAKAAGCSLDFVDGQWMEMLGRLRDGDVDLLAGATPTPGREEFAAFTAPYRSESFVVFTLANNTSVRSAATLDELFGDGRRIGTVAEYYYGEDIAAHLDALMADGRLHEAALSELNYQRLLNGEIDAFLDDPFVASSILRSRGWGERIVPTEFSTATGDVSFMISRQSVSAENIARFQEGLRQIQESGQLAAIIEDYRR